MEAKKRMGGARPGAGRKRLEAGEITVPVTIKMSAPQREKLRRLGGPRWVRERIIEAKEPTTE